MPVEIKIYHEDAGTALYELGVIARGLVPHPTAGAPATVEVVAADIDAVEVKIEPAAPAPAEEPKRRTRAKKSDAPQISTNPEDRQDPAAVEEQDKADEAAEAEATKAEQPKLTHDDVRKALKRYVDKFTFELALVDGPKIIGFAKASDIPDDQAALAEAISKIDEALKIDETTKTNPFGRKAAA